MCVFLSPPGIGDVIDWGWVVGSVKFAISYQSIISRKINTKAAELTVMIL